MRLDAIVTYTHSLTQIDNIVAYTSLGSKLQKLIMQCVYTVAGMVTKCPDIDNACPKEIGSFEQFNCVPIAITFCERGKGIKI